MTLFSDSSTTPLQVTYLQRPCHTVTVLPPSFHRYTQPMDSQNLLGSSSKPRQAHQNYDIYVGFIEGGTGKARFSGQPFFTFHHVNSA